MRIGHSSSDTQPGLARTCGDDVGGRAARGRDENLREERPMTDADVIIVGAAQPA